MTTSKAKTNKPDRGTAEHPWELNTPPGSAAYQAYRDEAASPPALVVQVGKTQLRYHLSCIEKLL